MNKKSIFTILIGLFLLAGNTFAACSEHENAAACNAETEFLCYWDDGVLWDSCESFTECTDLPDKVCATKKGCFVESGFMNDTCKGNFVKSGKNTAIIQPCESLAEESCIQNPNCYWGLKGINECLTKSTNGKQTCSEIDDPETCTNDGDGCFWNGRNCVDLTDKTLTQEGVWTGPVFGKSPGLSVGARIAKEKLDSSISKERDIKVLLIGWVKYFLSIVAVLSVISIVWAGVLYVTDFGDGSRVEMAKKILYLTVAGMLLILGSYAIVSSIMKGLF